MFKIRQSKYRHVYCDQPKQAVRDMKCKTIDDAYIVSKTVVFSWLLLCLFCKKNHYKISLAFFSLYNILIIVETNILNCFFCLFVCLVDVPYWFSNCNSNGRATVHQGINEILVRCYVWWRWSIGCRPTRPSRTI